MIALTFEVWLLRGFFFNGFQYTHGVLFLQICIQNVLWGCLQLLIIDSILCPMGRVVVLFIIGRKEGNVLFNDILNTLHFTVIWRRTYGKGHSDSEKGNLLPLLFQTPHAPWANALTHIYNWCQNTYVKASSSWEFQCPVYYRQCTQYLSTY